MQIALSYVLDSELDGLLTRLNQENEARQKIVRMNSFGMLLRSLRMLCKTPQNDPDGSGRLEQAERLRGEMSKEDWLSEDLRTAINEFLQHYVEWQIH